MRSWNNRLGIIAVCLSLLTLAVALGGRGPRSVFNWDARAGHARSGDAPAAPVPPAAPRADVEQHEHRHFGPHFGPRHHRGWDGDFGFRRERHHPGFVGLFFPLAQLLKLATALALIGLGLHLLRRSGGRPDDGRSDRPFSA